MPSSSQAMIKKKKKKKHFQEKTGLYEARSTYTGDVWVVSNQKSF